MTYNMIAWRIQVIQFVVKIPEKVEMQWQLNKKGNTNSDNITEKQ